MLKRGYRVFVWNEDMLKLGKDGKIDMNELVIKGFFDDVIDEEGMIPTEEIMKYVMNPSIFNLLDFEMHYDENGFNLEEKKDVKFVQQRRTSGNKSDRNKRKGGGREGFHRR